MTGVAKMRTFRPVTAWQRQNCVCMKDRQGRGQAIDMPNAAGARIVAAAIQNECTRAKRT